MSNTEYPYNTTLDTFRSESVLSLEIRETTKINNVSALHKTKICKMCSDVQLRRRFPMSNSAAPVMAALIPDWV